MNLSLINLHPSLRPPLPEWRRRILRLARRAAAVSVAGRAFPPAHLSVALLDDRRMAGLNWRHLRHRGPTDVLTFDYGDGGAEILVSLDTALRQARRRRRPLRGELTLYLAHGMLHLAGWNDQTAVQRRRMKSKERWLLQRLKRRV